MTRPGSSVRAVVASWLLAATVAAVTLGLLSLVKERGVAPDRFLSSSHAPLPRAPRPALDDEASRALYQPFDPVRAACDGPGS